MIRPSSAPNKLRAGLEIRKELARQAVEDYTGEHQ